MTRIQERHRYTQDGIKPHDLPRLGYADNLRRQAAREGSAALLAALRRYFTRAATIRTLGESISHHESDKARRA
jgi:hypothetical protein